MKSKVWRQILKFRIRPETIKDDLIAWDGVILFNGEDALFESRTLVSMKDLLSK